MFNDEEDESAVGAVRYPCMPSLVSLQQMRNRLHLAYLGRKLMKWTALATGRELRRLAQEINEAYKSFAEDLRNAFMLLARGRYFYPNLNKMVLENIPNKSSVLITSSMKTISGVKVIQYDIVESGVEPYEHLGIEKGGQKIHEAKIAWLDLLKRMVYMLELRTSFTLVDAAHKNATKKRNVLAKTIVPRILASVGYILTELEEQEREETFRLKRVKEKKMKKGQKIQKAGDEIAVCCCCLSSFEPGEEDITAESLCPQCTDGIMSSASSDMTIVSQISQDMTQANENEEKKRLETLMSHIDEVMFDLVNQPECMTPSTEKFIESCNKFKDKIEGFANAPLQLSLCDLCKKNENNETVVSEKPSCSASTKSCSASMKSCPATKKSIPPPEKPSQTGGEPKTELDYYETKTEEIVKVIKFKNKDGTIGEEKQVITIKTERKGPSIAEGLGLRAKSEHTKVCCDPMMNPSATKSKSEGSFAPEQVPPVSPTCSQSNTLTGCPICGETVSSTTVVGPKQTGTSTAGNKGTCCVDKMSSDSISARQRRSSDATCKDTGISTTGVNDANSTANCPRRKDKTSNKKNTTPCTTKIKIIPKLAPPIIICQHESSQSSRSSKSSDCITCNYGSKSSTGSDNVCKSCRRGSGRSASESKVCKKCKSSDVKPSICNKCGLEKRKPTGHSCPSCRSKATLCACDEKKKAPDKSKESKKAADNKSKKCPKCGKEAKKKKSQDSIKVSCECAKIQAKLAKKDSKVKSSKPCPGCGRKPSATSIGSSGSKTSLKSKPSCPNCSKPKSACPKCGKVKEDTKSKSPVSPRGSCLKCGKGKEAKPSCPTCGKSQSKSNIKCECNKKKDTKTKSTCQSCEKSKSQSSLSSTSSSKSSCSKCGGKKEKEIKVTCPTCGGAKSESSLSSKSSSKSKDSCPQCGKEKATQKKASCPVCSEKSSTSSLCEKSAPNSGCPSCGGLKQLKSSQNVSISEPPSVKVSCPICNKASADADKKKKEKEVKHTCKHCGQDKGKKGQPGKDGCTLCVRVESLKSLARSASSSKSSTCPTCGKSSSQSIVNEVQYCPLCGKKPKSTQVSDDGKKKKGKDKKKEAKHACKYCGGKDKKGKEKVPCPICSAAELKKALDCGFCDETSGPKKKSTEGSCPVCGKIEPCNEKELKEKQSRSKCPTCKKPKEPEKCKVCQDKEQNVAKSPRSCPTCGADVTSKSDSSIDSPCPSCNQKEVKKKKSRCALCTENANVLKPPAPTPSQKKPGCSCKALNSPSKKPSESTCPSCNAKKQERSPSPSSDSGSICPKCEASSKPPSKSTSICKHCKEDSIKSKSSWSSSSDKSPSDSNSTCQLCKEQAGKKSKTPCKQCKEESKKKKDSKKKKQKCTCPKPEENICKHCKKEAMKSSKSKCSCSSQKMKKSALKKSSSGCPVCDRKKKKSHASEDGCPICKKQQSQQKSSCEICLHSLDGMSGKSKEQRTCSFDPNISGTDSASGSDSLSNKSFGIETEKCCDSLTSSSSPLDDSDNDPLCCSTQTQKKSSTKMSPQKFQESCCVGESKPASKCRVCFLEMRDASVNTKAADRFDVRPVHMIPGATSVNVCCCKGKPAKICACRSLPICVPDKHSRPLRSKSFDEKDISYFGNFYLK